MSNDRSNGSSQEGDRHHLKNEGRNGDQNDEESVKPKGKYIGDDSTADDIKELLRWLNESGPELPKPKDPSNFFDLEESLYISASLSFGSKALKQHVEDTIMLESRVRHFCEAIGTIYGISYSFTEVRASDEIKTYDCSGLIYPCIELKALFQHPSLLHAELDENPLPSSKKVMLALRNVVTEAQKLMNDIPKDEHIDFHHDYSSVCELYFTALGLCHFIPAFPNEE